MKSKSALSLGRTLHRTAATVSEVWPLSIFSASSLILMWPYVIERRELPPEAWPWPRDVDSSIPFGFCRMISASSTLAKIPPCSQVSFSLGYIDEWLIIPHRPNIVAAVDPVPEGLIEAAQVQEGLIEGISKGVVAAGGVVFRGTPIPSRPKTTDCGFVLV